MTLPDDMARRSSDPSITNEEILTELLMFPTLRRALRVHELYLMTLLLERGMTWDEIAAGLNVTRQGASKRYKRRATQRFQTNDENDEDD